MTPEEKRHSPDQRARMRCMMRDIANQMPAWKDAYGEDVKLNEEDWKHMIVALLKNEKLYASIGDDGGIGNGIVRIGGKTEKMSVHDMALMIEAASWFGAVHGIVWTDPKQATENDYPQELMG